MINTLNNVNLNTVRSLVDIFYLVFLINCFCSGCSKIINRSYWKILDWKGCLQCSCHFRYGNAQSKFLTRCTWFVISPTSGHRYPSTMHKCHNNNILSSIFVWAFLNAETWMFDAFQLEAHIIENVENEKAYFTVRWFEVIKRALCFSTMDLKTVPCYFYK